MQNRHDKRRRFGRRCRLVWRESGGVRPNGSWSIAMWLVGLLLGGMSWTCSARAQVIFLPSWQQFSVSTSVSVPDRGSALLGSTGRQGTGRTLRGVPGLPNWGTNRGIARSRSAASVHVTVTDLAAWDAAILNQGRVVSDVERQERAGSALQAKLAASKAPGRIDRAGNLSLAEIRRLRAAAAARSVIQSSPTQTDRSSNHSSARRPSKP